jgi:hypothetical protein
VESRITGGKCTISVAADLVSECGILQCIEGISIIGLHAPIKHRIHVKSLYLASNMTLTNLEIVGSEVAAKITGIGCSDLNLVELKLCNIGVNLDTCIRWTLKHCVVEEKITCDTAIRLHASSGSIMDSQIIVKVGSGSGIYISGGVVKLLCRNVEILVGDGDGSYGIDSALDDVEYGSSFTALACVSNRPSCFSNMMPTHIVSSIFQI